MATTLSSQIYSSKDQTVSQLTEYLKTYLELENVSLVKGSFLSFLVESLATLTSNLIFYESSVYREFFLTTAQLPESIFNLSAFLGYNTIEATYSAANVLMTVPLTFTGADTTFTIPEDYKFKANTIPFITYYSTSVNVLNNSQVTITVTDGNKIYNLPSVVDTTSSEPQFRFILPVRQYENNIQEFQIDEDLQPYQFTNIDVPISGKVSTMSVEVRDPGGTSYQTYTEFNSTYLMSSTDYGYVSRRTEKGRRLYFGNGLIGIQPLPGSTVLVTVQETQGIDGNVIAGTINSGQRIYAVDSGITKSVNFEVTNPSPAIGGTDEESVEDIRQNSIDNLTSLSRLVTENDYINADVVMPNSPISTGSRPVLKRSDVRVNEIQLYVNLLYGSDIVPMRNAYKTYSLDTTYVPRGSTVTVSGVDYYTLFDLTIDSTINNTAYYNYIMNIINQVPALVRSYDPPAGEQPYVIPLSNLVVTRVGNGATFEMSYDSVESDFADTNCQMEILSNGVTYDMTNSASLQVFVLAFDDYTDIPIDQQTYYFTTSDPNGNNIARYSNTFTFRQSLDEFMLSNISTDATSVIVYDIPVIKASYYDSTAIVKADFETQVLQSMLTNMDFVNYRMLTDFVNLKFTNTTEEMKNMIYNKVTKLSVTDISSLPDDSSIGDRYIVAECDTSYGETYKNQIAQSTHVNRVWATTSAMPRPTAFHGSFGDSDDLISFGSIEFNVGYFGYAYSWDGVFWSVTESNPNAFGFRSGTGTYNLGLGIGGLNGSGSHDNCEIWNGSWATTSTMVEVRFGSVLFGSTSDALVCGGRGDSTALDTVEIWNGSSWATTTNISTAIFIPGGVGTTSDGIVFGGITGLPQTQFSDVSQNWNGSVWATTSNLNESKGAVGACGIPSDALCFGGEGSTYLDTTEIWDGSIWSITNSLNLSRTYVRGNGTVTSALSFGGTTSGTSIYLDVTEKWTGLTTWSFTEPTTDDIVDVTDKGYRYIYTGKNWVLPIYETPLQMSLEVFKEETYTGSNVTLAALVRTVLLSTFSDRFGSNIEIRRSEIIKAVQEIDGVAYCELITPESNIFFDFDLDDLTETQLLEYGPEYIYFTNSSISIRVL